PAASRTRCSQVGRKLISGAHDTLPATMYVFEQLLESLSLDSPACPDREDPQHRGAYRRDCWRKRLVLRLLDVRVAVRDGGAARDGRDHRGRRWELRRREADGCGGDPLWLLFRAAIAVRWR